MIEISFGDFEKLVLENNKRIYYYETSKFLELYFLIDSVFVKTALVKKSVDNILLFIQRPMFTGSIRLNRRVEADRSEMVTNIVTPESSIVRPIPKQEPEIKSKTPDTIQRNQSIEQKAEPKTNRDIIESII